LKAARNPVTGELEAKRVAQWVYQHNTALVKFGMKEDFSSLQKAMKIADEAKSAEYAFNKSAIAKALNVDPDRAIAEGLMTGTGRKQSVARLQELVRIAKQDKTGSALDGLKAGIGDYFQKSTTLTARDLAGNNLESYAKIDKFVKEFRPALRASGLYSDAELNAFDNVHRALGAIAQQARPNAAFTGSPTFELFSRLAGGGASVVMGRIPGVGVARSLWEMVSGRLEKQINEAVSRAIFDPRYAEAINRLAINMKKSPEKAAEIFTRRIAVFGQIATKTEEEAK
jgi:hypothetical protein